MPRSSCARGERLGLRDDQKQELLVCRVFRWDQWATLKHDFATGKNSDVKLPGGVDVGSPGLKSTNLHVVITSSTCSTAL